MSHPGPLLTDFVDGTLGAAERADVEAHLATCPTCRDEVALARAARSALRALPVATPPPGLAEGAIAEASRPTQAADPRSKPSTTRRWLAAAAVAAAIGLIAVAAPKLGPSPAQSMAAGSDAAADQSFARATGVEVVGANVSQAQLATVAAALGGIQPGEVAPASGVSSAATVQPPDLQAGRVLPAELPQAAACLDQAFGDTPGTLTRVLRARFEGTPAYFGLFAVGPGAGLAPTRVQLLVASVRGCDALASAYALL
jgi:hypothetical protein